MRIKTLCFCQYVSRLWCANRDDTYLFVANGEFASGDAVILSKVLKLHDRVALQDRSGKFDVGLGILVSRLWNVSAALIAVTESSSRRRQFRQGESQVACLTLRASLLLSLRRTCRILIGKVSILNSMYEQGLRTADEESVTGKHGFASAILHEEADAVLSMARRMDALDGNVSNLEGLLMFGRLNHALTIFTANDVELGCAEGLKLRCVLECMNSVRWLL
jgi:hypothetical protein